jgi:hypothetical protein
MARALRRMRRRHQRQRNNGATHDCEHVLLIAPHFVLLFRADPDELYHWPALRGNGTRDADHAYPTEIDTLPRASRAGVISAFVSTAGAWLAQIQIAEAADCRLQETTRPGREKWLNACLLVCFLESGAGSGGL